MAKIIFLALLVFSNISQAAEMMSLQISMTGFRSEKGHVLVSVFNDQDPKAFPEEIEKAIVKIKITLKEAENFIIENLPAGDYAVAVLHDENDNGVMDKKDGLIKFPKEGFGFSNNSMGTFGPPSFKKAKISITTSLVKTSIKIKHM